MTVEKRQQDEADDLFDTFINQFWHDYDHGGLGELSRYLGKYPRLTKEITREYHELVEQLHAEIGERKPPGSLESDERLADDEDNEAESIGYYKILDELGRGGQGVVYKAQDTRLPRIVAIKVLLHLGEAPEALMRRFRREAEITSKLNHPGICGLIETGMTKGAPYIVMPFLVGEPLSKRIVGVESKEEFFAIGSDDDAPEDNQARKTTLFKSERPELESLIRLFESIGIALHSAHEVGVVHRDIKPANIFVVENEHPIILDFGLAHMEDESMPALTQSGDVFGTPAYMPPEQVLGDTKHIDRRSDVWSLGVSLYECLTGQRPFQGTTRHALVEAIRWETPQKPSKLNKSVPMDLVSVVEVALAKDPDKRYQSAEAMVEDLKRVRCYEPILAKPPGLMTRFQRWVRRRPGAALALLSVVVGLIITLLLLREAKEAQRAAETNLSEYERLADLRRLDDLEREMDNDLWPSHPNVLARMRNWISRAEKLQARIVNHEEAIVTIRERPRDKNDEHQRDLDSVRIAEQELLAREQALTAMLTRATAETGEVRKTTEAALAKTKSDLVQLRKSKDQRKHWRFIDIKDQWRHSQLEVYLNRSRVFFGLDGKSPDKIDIMRKRIEKADAVVRQHAEFIQKKWQQASAEISENPLYDETLKQLGGTFPAQYGLVPLGNDPQSGLAEFVHLASGEIPERDSEGQVVMTGDSGVVFVLIPCGSFEMGTDLTDARRASPSHRVTLSSFLLSKFELTQSQWLSVMPTNPSRHQPGPDHTLGTSFRLHPVELISWSDSEKLLRRLSLTFPTEAQWEYACAAGTDSLYFHGNDLKSLESYANVADEGSRDLLPRSVTFVKGLSDGFAQTAPIGSFKANPWGLHEISGNLQEWCADWAGPYDIPIRSGDGLRLSLSRDSRVLRGGHCLAGAFLTRRRARNWSEPNLKSTTFGLRPALSILSAK